MVDDRCVINFNDGNLQVPPIKYVDCLFRNAHNVAQGSSSLRGVYFLRVLARSFFTREFFSSTRSHKSPHKRIRAQSFFTLRRIFTQEPRGRPLGTSPKTQEPSTTKSKDPPSYDVICKQSWSDRPIIVKVQTLRKNGKKKGQRINDYSVRLE